MGIGVGHQPEPVQGRHPPVHRRVRRQAGLDREDVRREVPVALVDGVEAGLRTERREPRGPDMGGDEIRAGPGLQRNFEQMPGIETEDRPSVRVQIADSGQTVDHPIRGFEVRGVDQVVDLPGLVELLVDGRDLDRQHEPDRGAPAPARRGQALLDVPLQVRTQAEQPRLRRHELVLQLRPPGRVREVAGADDADALLAGPDGQMFEIAVSAGCAGVLGVDVQVGVEPHEAELRSTASGGRWPRSARSGTGASSSVNPS